MIDICNKNTETNLQNFISNLLICRKTEDYFSIFSDINKKDAFLKTIFNDSPLSALVALLDNYEISIKKTFDLFLENKISVKDAFIELQEQGKIVVLPKIVTFKDIFLLKGEFVVENSQIVKNDNIYIFSNKNYIRYNKNVLLFIRFLRLLDYKFYDFNYLLTEEGEVLLPITSLENLFLLTESPYHMYLKFSSYGNYYENYFVTETVKLFIALLLSGVSKTNPNNFLANKVSNTLLYLENAEEDSYSEVDLLDKYSFSDEEALATNLGFSKKPETVKPSKIIKAISEELRELTELPLAKLPEETLKIINIPTLKLLYKICNLNLNNVIVNRLFVLKNIYA
ncbi:MAG: hypothetical protein QXP88_00315 [Thermoproteota archaeon]